MDETVDACFDKIREEFGRIRDELDRVSRLLCEDGRIAEAAFWLGSLRSDCHHHTLDLADETEEDA